jgi:uncharacterized pyridoxal phosphate-containing UPF0001 family protein
MTQIGKNLQKIVDTIPNHVCLVAVSKTKPVPEILEAFHAGQLYFGDNRIQ